MQLLLQALVPQSESYSPLCEVVYPLFISGVSLLKLLDLVYEVFEAFLVIIVCLLELLDFNCELCYFSPCFFHSLHCSGNDMLGGWRLRKRFVSLLEKWR